MKTYFWLFFCSLFIGTGPLAAADVPTVRLVVVPLGEQTIKQCKSSTVKYLRSKGFQTSVLRQGSNVVKIWGIKPVKQYSLQIECDRKMGTKAIGFSHPYTHNEFDVETIIDKIFN